MRRHCNRPDRDGREWANRDSAERWAADVSTVTNGPVDVYLVIDVPRLDVVWLVKFRDAEVEDDEFHMSRYVRGVCRWTRPSPRPRRWRPRGS